MKRYLSHIIYLIILFVLFEAAANSFSASIAAIPNLLLIFILITALNFNFKETLWFSFAAGMLLELYSGLYFGALLLPVLVIALAAYVITRSLTTQDPGAFTVVLIVGIATLIFPLLSYLYQSLAAGFGNAEFFPLADYYSWGLLWAALGGVILYYPIRQISNLIEKYYEKSL